MKAKLHLPALLVAYVAIRVWAIACGFQHFPYPERQYLFSDIQLYDWWANNIINGQFPIGDDAWQYPPLAAVIFVLGFKLHANMVGFEILVVVADLAILWMLIRATHQRFLQRQKSDSQAVADYTAVLIWTLAPLIMGPVMMGRFDMFPTAASIAALLVLPSVSRFSFFTALGTLLKVWPLLLLASVKRKQLPRTIVTFAFVVIGATIALHSWWPDGSSFLSGQKSRGLQIESVGALPYLWWHAGPHDVMSAYQYGAIEIVADGTHTVSLIMTLIGLFAFVYLGIQRLRGHLDHAPAAEVALLAVLIAITTSRVLSPQYMVWVLGLLAVCAINPTPHLARVTTLLIISTAIGQVIYPPWYVALQEGAWYPIAGHTVRIVTLVAATVILWRSVTRPGHRHAASPAAD